MRKKGITLSMVVVVVTVLAILTTAVVTTVYKDINNTNFTFWVQEITMLQDIMRENRENVDKYLLGTIEYNVASNSISVITEQFKGEAIKGQILTLYRINMTKAGLSNSNFGNDKDDEDVYAYSKETGKVYYIKGMVLNGYRYYTLLPDIQDRFLEEVEDNQELSTIVFEPSSTTYTKSAVKVIVNVPKTYTDISITTSNAQVTVGEQVVQTGKYTYTVNTGNYAGNYTITVSYNNGTTKTEQYVVDIFDNVAPVISSTSKTNNVVTVNATDEKSGIKEIRYITAVMPSTNVQEYFRTNGTKILGKTFKVDSSVTNIVVYVEDNAGNFTTKTI